jgi:hypothetical protein
VCVALCQRHSRHADVDAVQSRNNQGQRVPLASVETASISDRSGVPYYVYEAVQQGSPTYSDASRDTYRQSLCVTAARNGLDGSPFLYTLALACPSELWPELEEGFNKAVQSFELLQPGRKYIPPDKDPWLFF